MRILTAEDEIYMNEMYRDALEPLGHQIIATDNGDKCLAEYKSAFSKDSAPFDLVLLDYLMPEKDGVTLAKEILEINPKQKIIFVSAHGSLLSQKIKEINGGVDFLKHLSHKTARPCLGSKGILQATPQSPQVASCISLLELLSLGRLTLLFLEDLDLASELVFFEYFGFTLRNFALRNSIDAIPNYIPKIN